MTTPIGQFVDTTIGRTSTNPFITIIKNRAPIGNDGINNALQVGQRWIDSSDKDAEYFLLNFTSSNGVVQANWVQIGSGGNTAETLTGNSGGAVTVDSSNNINVVGDGTTGLLFSGSSHTLTGTLSTIPNSALANSAITVVAGTGVSITTSPVSLGGSTTISGKIAQAAASSALLNAGVSSFSNTEFAVDSNGYVTLATSIPASFVTDSGTATPASNSLTIQGSSGITTSGSGHTVTVTGNYSTGSWTPTIAFGGASTGVTYVSQIGEYTRIGNVVYFSCLILLSSKGSATGNATVGGFPVALNATEQNVPIANALVTYTAGYSSSFFYFIGSPVTSIPLYQYNPSTGGTAVLADTNFGNSSRIQSNGFYFVT